MSCRRTKSIRLALLLVSLPPFATGCGSSGTNATTSVVTSSIANPHVLDVAARAKVERVVAKVVKATTDKHLRGPKHYKVVCLRSGEPGAGNIDSNQVGCNVEAFYDGYKGKRGGYIWNEHWVVPIVNGKLGRPRISGPHGIRNFLREDNKRNCTGRHRPDQCLPQSLGGELPG
jgi:hypothetical protein